MNLNESVRLIMESFSSVFNEKNIVSEVNLDSSSPLINADRSQMEQVFLNIVKNKPGKGAI